MEYNPGVPTTKLDRLFAVLIGPSWVGKTTMGATWSEFYRDGADKENPVVLEDMFHVDFDDGAQDGLKERGILIPRFQNGDKPVVPFLSGKSLTNAHQELTSALKDIVTKKMKEFPNFCIMWDSITTYMQQLDAYYTTRTNKSTDKYNKIFAIGKGMLDEIRALPCHHVLIAHTTVATDWGDKDGAAARAKARIATELPGDKSVKADIIGKTRKFLINNTSMMMVVEADARQNVHPSKWDRYVRPWGTPTIEGKQRWVLSLEEKMKADFRVIKPRLGLGKEGK